MGHAKSRFISFFGIIMLGVMMLTGLMSVGPDMRRAQRVYFEQQNLFDLRVVSTLGLNEDDIEAIAATEGVSAVMPVKSVDCTATIQKSDVLTIRIQQLPPDPAAETEENMNRVVLLEGRMPEAEGECVVAAVGTGSAPAIGSVLTLSGAEDALPAETLTVVGIVQDPLHFSIDSDSSTAGTGKLRLVVFVADVRFTADYYSSCYLKVADSIQY